ncbi:hypothetical protein B0T24DRAFT_657468 [Lasiosphaeria ovina]|uniref:NAD(P)-binding protein n=1 Tax=Lasiosphaeria ovina TaxID=92902 RepID=A0AAE0KBZ5_9PEZI|nr:hypothetical protein B0T24DRAFT_657468 [Lasiosphaeria ovina]
MSVPTVVFVTGASRGIGKTLVQTYLARPNHIVVGSVRDTVSTNAEALRSLSAADGSRLLLVNIESTSYADPTAAVRELEAAGIDHVDIVIANAGGAGGGLAPLTIVTPENVADVLALNALGPLALYQAVLPLLKKSPAPKWVSVTSAVASIGNMENFHSHVAPAYGIGKAALNWITVAAHCGNKELIAFVLHPGLVQSDGGNRAARGMGLPQAPIALQQSADAIIKLIDKATREKTSARFFDAIQGTEIPW